MKRVLKRTLASFAVCLMLLTVGCSTTAAPTDTTSTAEPVAEGILLTAQLPERGNMQLDTSFVGTVQPDQVVSVVPKLMGTVKTVEVSVGQVVKKGDLLMTLDDKDVMPSVKQAEAGYNSAKAQTEQMTGSSYKTQLANLDAQFDSTLDAYENAKVAVDDLEQELSDAKDRLAELQGILAGGGTLTEDEQKELAKLPATIAALPSAIARADDGEDMARKYHNNARSSYNAMKVEGQEDIQKVADATLAQAEAGLNVARAQLENTKVYSPIDGVIESISVSELNPVSQSAPAFIISNKEAYTVSFNVPSASIAAMEVGNSVTVRKGERDYAATITEVSTIINQQTGLFTVKATLEGTVTDLLTGVMVKVTAATQKSENAILLAQDSVYYDNGAAYVYLAVDGVAVKTFVETGISNPEQIEILSGLGDNDLVVTSWHPNLVDGALIRLAA